MDLDELIALLVNGSTGAVGFTGIVRRLNADLEPQTWRVWRRGRLARIENPPGRLVLVAGERRYWRSWPSDPVPVVLPRSPDHDDFEISRLTMLEPERYWSEWLRDDPALVTSSLRSTDHDGRPAWTFLAPEVKGVRPRLTVDAEIGLVLETSRDDAGAGESWSEVRTDVDLDDAFFRVDPA